MKIKLADNTRTILEKWQTHEAGHFRHLASAILLTADGKTPEEIASELRLRARTVTKWLEDWEKKGFNIFADGKNHVAIINGQVMNVPAPPVFEQEQIQISPDDSMAEAGRKVLLHHLNAMCFYESIARTGEHSEGVHKMRVATRRLRSAHKAFKPYLDKRYYKQIAKPLRHTAKLLGAVRDMDVFLIKTHQYIDKNLKGEETPLLPLLDRVREDYLTARHALNDWLDSKAYRKFVNHFQEVLEQPAEDNPALRVKYVVPEMIYARVGAVRRYDSLLEDADLPTLHQLRIEFKRLRYTLEFFESLLEIDDYLKEVRAIQEILGDLNDSVVALHIINRLYKRIPKEERDGVRVYREVRYDEQDELVEQFSKAWENFNRAELRQKLAGSIAQL